MGCPVDTCADEVSVTFLKDDDVVDTMDLSNSQITHNLNLLVDEDTVGMYACKVDIDGFSTVQQFNITGEYYVYIYVHCTCMCPCHSIRTLFLLKASLYYM